MTDDPFVAHLFSLTEQAVFEVDEDLTMHDFRVVKGLTHSNLIFDIVVPHECKKGDSEIIDEVTCKIKEKDESLYLVVTLDRAYVSSSNH